MLKRCLSSLLPQTRSEHFDVELVVIENETPTRLDAEFWTDLQGVRTHHVVEPVPGICPARNAALAFARQAGFDCIALIDDDEIAQPGWLEAHYKTLTHHEAMATHGPVYFDYEVPPPAWWTISDPEPGIDGAATSWAATNNNLLSCRIFDLPGFDASFDPELVHSGGDIDFFQRLNAAGGKIVWSSNARVTEWTPLARLQMDRFLEREEGFAKDLVKTIRKRKGDFRVAWRFGLRLLRELPLISRDRLRDLLRQVDDGGIARLRWRRRIAHCRGYWKGLWSPARDIRKIDGA